MTREELREHCERQIKQFERAEKIMPVTPNDWRRYEEHKMVLELLEPEPCEDAINRQALLNMYECLDEDSRVYAGQVVRDVKALPPVTPTKCIATVKFSKEDMQKLVNEKMKDIVVERKKGKWIKEMSLLGWDGCSYQCSECGRSIHLDTEVEDLIDYPYCHCGAEMKIEEEMESEE